FPRRVQRRPTAATGRQRRPAEVPAQRALARPAGDLLGGAVVRGALSGLLHGFWPAGDHLLLAGPVSESPPRPADSAQGQPELARAGRAGVAAGCLGVDLARHARAVDKLAAPDD